MCPDKHEYTLKPLLYEVYKLNVSAQNTSFPPVKIVELLSSISDKNEDQRGGGEERHAKL